jgi:glycerol uptake facilitator-like aquaporin
MPKKLFVLKLIHTIIFLVESAAILYLVESGARRRYGRKRNIAIGLVAAETVVYLGNKQTCPMTNMARSLGDETGNDWIADIFLPRWFAPLIPPICGTLALFGLILPVIETLRRRIAN